MPTLDAILLVAWESESSPGSEEPLPTDLRDRIMGLKYTDKARGADECTIRFSNQDLSLIDDPRLAEGNKLIVQWGYPHEMGPRREVTITEVTGWSTLSIKCGSTRELQAITSQRLRTFENATLIDVAEEIALELGYRDDRQRQITASESPVTYPGITQSGETDYAFLTRMADREDLVFRIVNGVFHFHPLNLEMQPQIVLTFFDSSTGDWIGEPKIDKGTLGIPGESRRRAQSPREREAVEGEASNATDTRRVQLGDMITVRDPEANSWTNRAATRADVEQIRAQGSVAGSSAATEEEATNQARRERRRAERTTIEISGTIVGKPTLEAESVIRCEGFGEKLTGNYYVNEATHDVGNGFTIAIKLKRDSVSGSSAGSASASANRTASIQRLQQRQAQLDAQFQAGTLSSEAHASQSAALESQRQAILSNAGDEAEGRKNTGGAADASAAQATTYRDSETNEWRTRYAPP